MGWDSSRLFVLAQSVMGERTSWVSTQPAGLGTLLDEVRALRTEVAALNDAGQEPK